MEGWVEKPPLGCQADPRHRLRSRGAARGSGSAGPSGRLLPRRGLLVIGARATRADGGTDRCVGAELLGRYPALQSRKIIASTLYSVFSQTYPVKEVIVIDDGSKDRSAAIVEAIAEVRPEIVFWSQPNRGAHHTINTGIQRATGDLVAILNSDDIYEPTRFRRIAAAFEAEPDLDAATTNMTFIDSDGNQIANTWFDEALAFYRQPGDLGQTLINGNIFMTTSNLVARRRLFDEIGLLSDLRYAHDVDFFLRLIAKGRRLAFIDEPHLRYRIHATNTISEGVYKVKLEWAAVTAFYLNQIWDGASHRANWLNGAGYVEILRKHQLTELVLLFMAYFKDRRAETLERHSFGADREFLDLVQAVMR
jgi:glycosyltransferase involved in cell wall biosynthesis